jgi:hypothetical protein
MIARMSLQLHRLSVAPLLYTVALLAQTACVTAESEKDRKPTLPAAVPPRVAGSANPRAGDGRQFRTDYARITIDGNGFITSIVARASGKEYSPAGHPSPLLSLHEGGQPNDNLVSPATTSFSGLGGEITLRYPPTFGLQNWNSAWSLYDAETLMSMAVAWDATFALSTSQDAIDKTATGSFLLHTVTRGKDGAGKDAWVVGTGDKVGK